MLATLLDRLRCPQTQQRLAFADDAMIAGLNASIKEGTLRRQDGQPVTEPLQSGLLREDGALLYPIRDDLASLLLQEAIMLGSGDG